MPPETGIRWNKVTWYSKILAIFLFVILICSAFYFGIWYKQQISPGANPTTGQVPLSAAVSYKHAFYGDIPSTWSTYENSAAAYGTNPAQTLQELTSANGLVYSFSPTGINEGDGAFSQVDFYYLTDTVAQALINQAKQDKEQITEESVGGLTSTVIHYPTDNGQIDKDGTGGEDYLIGYTEEMSSSAKIGGSPFLLMRNWSLGNQEFENGFQYFLQTAHFQTEG